MKKPEPPRKQRRITVLQVAVSILTSTLIVMAQGVHSVRVLVILACITTMSSVVFIAEVLERFPLFAKLTGFHRHVESISKGRWPRRPFERMTDWYNRVCEAQHEICEASWAYVQAAQVEGHMLKVGDVEQWMLPTTHPAAIRLAKARGEPLLTINSAYRGAM